MKFPAHIILSLKLSERTNTANWAVSYMQHKQKVAQYDHWIKLLQNTTKNKKTSSTIIIRNPWFDELIKYKSYLKTVKSHEQSEANKNACLLWIKTKKLNSRLVLQKNLSATTIAQTATIVRKEQQASVITVLWKVTHKQKIEQPLHNQKKKSKQAVLQNPLITPATAGLTINFIRKERTYTKLKYSRVPQYDTSSNASAALLAGLLGFIISEKFGFEMVDSGDFFVAGMYLLMCMFTIRLFLKTSNCTADATPVYSPLWILRFYNLLIVNTMRIAKSFLKAKVKKSTTIKKIE